MAKKIEKPEQPAEDTKRTWFFPTLGVSVKADTEAQAHEEAFKLVENQEEDTEVEDVDA